MNDDDPSSVLRDDYDAIGTNVELIIVPWLLSMLAAWAVQYIAKRYRPHWPEPAYRESVFYGTWLFFAVTNIRFLSDGFTPNGLFILALLFFPLPAFMIPCTVYYVRTLRAHGTRSLVVVAVIATMGIIAQIGWLDYVMADAPS